MFHHPSFLTFPQQGEYLRTNCPIGYPAGESSKHTMKWNKQQEAEARKVYDLFWDSYFSGDESTFVSLLDDEFKMIGTSETEVCHNKAEAITFFRTTTNEIYGKAELRNREISLVPLNGLILINEMANVYVLIETEWRFYSKIRLSTLLHDTESGWKVVHQHGSMPDTRVQEGETLAFEQIKTENLQLRDAVSRRTVELEDKNRELEIEAAMERVRVKALAMHKSEDFLATALEIFQVLNDLGINPLRSGLSVMNEQSQEVEAWSVTKGANNIAIPMHARFSADVHSVSTEIFRHWKMQDPHWKIELTGDALRSFVEGMPRDYVPMDESTGKLPFHIQHIVFHYFSFSKGVVFAGTDHHFDAEETAIMQKFTGVFAFAYTRFLDLQKAEAQAREAQIEASLEKVRAKVMAMNTSQDLNSTSLVFGEQLRRLGIDWQFSYFWLIEEDKDDNTFWITWPDHQTSTTTYSLAEADESFKECIIAWRNQERIHGTQVPVEQVQAWLDTFERITQDAGGVAVEIMKADNFKDGVYYYDAMIRFGSFGILMNRATTDEEKHIQSRFATEFERAYTRFLDLLKAEAQARESQIQLALERIRARTMAMHNSEELAAVASVVFDQLTDLGIQHLASGFVIFDKHKPQGSMWMSYQGGSFPKPFEVNFTVSPVLMRVYNAWKEGEAYYINNIEDEHYVQHIQLLKKQFGRPIDEAMERTRLRMLSEGKTIPDKMVMQHTFFKNGSLVLHNFTSIEEQEILNRFANVFDQTYTRFLDLQKAEAQAREAMIEAALERVRSLALGMRQSEEVGNVTDNLFAELNKLSVNIIGCSIVVIHEEKDIMELWRARSNVAVKAFERSSFSKTMDILKNNLPEWFTDFSGALRKRKNHLIKEFNTEERSLYLKTMAEQYNYTGDEKAKLMEITPLKIVTHYVFFKLGFLALLSGRKLSDDDISITRRFTEVFDFAYTRFFDLKKAEAQAREAKIETALEKVRSRTMGMQSSDELPEVANLLFLEVQALGIPAWSCGYNILSEDKKSSKCIMSSEGEIQTPFTLPLTEHESLQPWHEAIIRNEDFFVYAQGGKELAEHYQYMKSLPELKSVFQQFDDANISLPTYQVNHLARFTHGFLLFITYEPVPEAHSIFQRFSKVFEQTYTRFLDLKKAEAQAREAQIEAALERVRSRTMAMHKSEELLQVITVVAEQLQQLNFRFGNVSFAVRNQDHDYKFWFSGPGLRSPYHIHVPYINNPMFERVRHFQKEDLSIYTDILSIEESSQWHQHVFDNSELKSLPAQTKDYILNNGYARTIAFMPTIMLIIGNYASQPYTEEENNIFKRFAGVFEQSYTRFLDLQKAEAQTREAQIEAGLERVRSRTMGMHQSSELSEVIERIYRELQDLKFDAVAADLMIFTGDKKGYDVWVSGGDGTEGPYRTPESLFDHPHHRGTMEAWLSGDDLRIAELTGESFMKYFEIVMDDTAGLQHLSEESKRDFFNTGHIVHTEVFTKHGCLRVASLDKRTDEQLDIQKRFAKIFDQTYTRFLDLQKAEANAREAQIETALEKVRSRSLAMHKSDEIKDVVAAVMEKMTELNIEMNGGVSLITFTPGSKDFHHWFANPGQISAPLSMHLPYFDNLIFNDCIDAMEKGMELLAKVYSFEEKIELFGYAFEHSELKNAPEDWKNWIMEQPYFGFSFAIQKNSAIFLNDYTGKLFSKEENELLKRFAKVFEQAYVRFLDLQKSEAQAREAQIEASLERVRSKAMAMHKSEDLSEAVATVFGELDKLSLGMLRCGIGILDKEKPRGDIWITVKSEHGDTVQVSGDESLDVHPLLLNAYKAWLRQEDYDYVLQGSDLASYYKALTTTHFQSQVSEAFHAGKKDQQQYYFNAVFQDGSLFAFLETPITDEVKLVMKRFAGVFNLTYKRFLDLQRAETQAREATIEAALEKVRGKAMAMNDTKDLSSTILLAFSELNKLGIRPLRFGVGLINREQRKAQLYAATSSEDGDSLALMGWILFEGHPVFEQIFDSWVKGEDYFPILEGQQLKSYYELLAAGLSVPKLPDWKGGEKQYGHFFPLPVSCLYAWADQSYQEPDVRILKRFASIVELTFKRYLELQKSEANARDAVRQASLDRVRAQTASMRTTADLERITPLMWNELTTLGVPFIRCGVFIMDDETQIVHTYLSTPEGNEIAAIHLPYSGIRLTEQSVAHWRNQSVYSEYWDKEDFLKWTRQLIDLGHIKSAENYQAGSAPEQLHLHFIPFAQGMLYVGSTDPLPEDSLDLIQSLANAFATSYARYEDFNKLEGAKKKTEQALADLESAKDQLVQQEKLASLGQLTAGIAHEIKNPLNFVNNFSEVSMELLDEMLEELEKGNSESVKSISDDIKANLDKIHEHGSRADSIVKSMLLHSRGGSGQKEPTDLNALIREYVNLTFHGMRAGKHPINVQIDLQLEETTGTAPVIVEDISRVIVNLCNNAFDAMRSKLSDSSQKSGYTPKLTVRTTRDANHTLIEIADNGPGIPEDIKDKILQPFFTTKKGTQGTGLGLSITNDIVKAHGGELKVESEEGRGSTFIIQLPVTVT